MVLKQIVAAIVVLALVGCASPGQRGERGARSLGKPVANPSAIVAAELAFARLAKEKGQWTAFRETAADDAVMFVPTLTNAKHWLKGKQDPKQAVTWQPHKIYMSCDGSMAVATGVWQNAKGGTGKFITIWRNENFGKHVRGPGKEAEWKWVFDHGWALDKPLEEPDFVKTEVADCNRKEILLAAPPPLHTESSGETGGRSRQWGGGTSADDTFIWGAGDTIDGTRVLTVGLLRKGGYAKVIDERFPASK